MAAAVPSNGQGSHQQYCPGCAENTMTYAVRAGKGVEVRCTLCGMPLGISPRDTRTVRTLSGL